MKKYFLFLIVAFVFLSFAGCYFSLLPKTPTEEYTENYLEIYHEFLNYSLGNYVVVSKHTKRIPSLMSNSIIYTEWTLRYTRYDGEVRTFSFDNFGEGYGRIAHNLVKEAGSIWVDCIEQDIINQYFGPLAMNPLARNPRLSIKPILLTAEKHNEILSPQSGLSLHSITLPELQIKWDITYSVAVEALEYEHNFDILERFKAMIRTLSEYTGHNRTVFGLSVYGEDGLEKLVFRGYYDKQTDTFNRTYN
jgi:hypothetical protein